MAATAEVVTRLPLDAVLLQKKHFVLRYFPFMLNLYYSAMQYCETEPVFLAFYIRTNLQSKNSAKNPEEALWSLRWCVDSYFLKTHDLKLAKTFFYWSRIGIVTWLELFWSLPNAIVILPQTSNLGQYSQNWTNTLELWCYVTLDLCDQLCNSGEATAIFSNRFWELQKDGSWRSRRKPWWGFQDAQEGHQKENRWSWEGEHLNLNYILVIGWHHRKLWWTQSLILVCQT